MIEIELVEKVKLIDISDEFYGLIFTQTKSDADMVAKELDDRGYQAAALHGDIAQVQREKILARFRSKKTKILVATDVAARGIDVTGLSHVVNYAMPFDGPTYIHRIGRTGRAGAKGMAFTLVRPEERRRLQYLQNAIRRSAKGEMKLSEIPSVEEVIEVKKTRLFDDIKTKIGLNDFVAESVSEESAAVEDSQDDEIVSLESQGVVSESNESVSETAAVETEKKFIRLAESHPVKLELPAEHPEIPVLRGYRHPVIPAVERVIDGRQQPRSPVGIFHAIRSGAVHKQPGILCRRSLQNLVNLESLSAGIQPVVALFLQAEHQLHLVFPALPMEVGKHVEHCVRLQ